ncbi:MULTISPECIES: phage tail tape measure protein [unclassified Microbacterium]|uniref:phage tail tape measure protein n=1 Tax=unclassified Microbacterium TaxID=2609290 RepID=UPI00364AE641
MSERVVKVRVSAQVAEYQRGMLDAAKSTREVGSEAEKLAQKREAFNALGMAGIAAGGMITAGFGLAVKKFADFDEAMSAVSSATHESSENMDLLRQAAIDAGASTVFSAEESANAIEELAKAGVSTADILNGGLRGALDLASAGGLGVAEAAGIASTALTQFGLKGQDMSHVADLLAAGAGKAMGDVTDLSAALNQTGLVASSTGLSIEETTAGLAAFASQGLLGSDAGTSFKTMLQRLTPQSAEAQKMMDQLGISAYDASGQFVGLATYAGSLQSAMKELTPEQRNAAMSVMFGSDAVRAATVLYSEGAQGISEWTDAVNDQGYAADTARRRLDNLKGDIEALGGAFDSALIQTGSVANDTLRTMAQALTGLIDMYNDLPAPVQEVISVVGGATGAVLLAGGTAFSTIPKWLEYKSAIQGAGFSMKSIGLTAGAAGLALGGLFLVVGELAAKHQQATALAQSYADTIADGAAKIGDSARKIAVDELKKGGDWLSFNWQSAYDAAGKLGVSLDTVTDAAMGNQAAMAKLKPYYDALGGDTAKFYDIASKTGMSAAETRLALEAMTNGIGSQNEAIKRGIEIKGQEQEANAGATEATKSAADSYMDEAKRVDDLNSKLRQLIDQVNEANGANQDAIGANIAYQDTLASVAEQVAKISEGQDGYSATLDLTTEAGRDNMGMLKDLAKDAWDAAAAQLQLDGDTAGFTARLEESRQKLYDAAKAMGASDEQAAHLRDTILSIPEEKKVDILADASRARWTIDDFLSQYGTLNGTIEYRAVMPDLNGDASGNGHMGTYATGGRVVGPGSSTSDSIMARLSNGEYVLTAEDVANAGGADRIDEWRNAITSGSYSSPMANLYNSRIAEAFDGAFIPRKDEA